jgi:DNA-binding MarR family transcriptional regulator
MSQNNTSAKMSGRFAYDGIHRLFHEKARLSILSSLAAHADGLLFNELKSLCKLTDGNLSRQIQLLQESGLVEVWKGTEGRRPRTLCRLTESGRKQFADYISVLQKVVADAHISEGQDSQTAQRNDERRGLFTRRAVKGA